jgi:hypothetical protein
MANNFGFQLIEDYSSIVEAYFIHCAIQDPANWKDYFILAKEVTLEEWRNRTISKETLQKTTKWKQAQNGIK